MAFTVAFADQVFTEANFLGQAYADEANGFPAALQKMVQHVGAAFRAPVTGSLAVGTGAKAATTFRNLGLYVGQTARLVSRANPANWMLGSITAYTATTGAVTVTATSSGGSGTLADFDLVPEMPATLSIAGLTVTASMLSSETLAVNTAAGDRRIPLSSLATVLAPLVAPNLPAVTTTLDNATANAVGHPLTVTRTTSGVPAVGIGTGVAFVTETSSGNNEIGAAIESVATSVTAAAEAFDMVFRTMAGGAAAAERARLRSDGRMSVVADGTADLDVPTKRYADAAREVNRVINGGFLLDFVSSSNPVTPAVQEAYVVNRWALACSVPSKITAQHITSTIAGFAKSLRLTTAAAYVATAGQWMGLVHRIEGIEVADLGWGAAGAAPIGLSFTAKASIGGTYSVAIRNATSPSSRAYLATFALTANVAQRVALQIPGDVTGTWDKGFTTGIELWFDLGSHVDLTVAPGSWQVGNYVRGTGAVAMAATLGATFELTGVRLERLPSLDAPCSPYVAPRLVEEWKRCARFYHQITLGNRFLSAGAGHINGVPVLLPVPMRVTPTAIQLTAGTFANLQSQTLIMGSSIGGRYEVVSAAVGDCYVVDVAYALSAEL